MLIPNLFLIACTQSAFEAPRLLLAPPGLPGDAGAAQHAADFDGDGRVDLLRLTVITGPALQLEFLGQDPQGALESPVTSSFAIANSALTDSGFGAEVADFNGDGRSDLALRLFDGGLSQLQLYLGQSDGSFALDAALPPSSVGFLLKTGEFNGQPGAEIVLAESITTLSSRARVLEWTPGGLQELAVTDTLSISNPVGLLVVDLDGDADLDIVIDNGSNFIFRQVNGQFPGFSGFVDSIPGNTVEQAQLLAGDVDGDGDADLINVSTGVLQVLRNSGNGGMVAEPVQLLPPAPLLSTSTNSRVALEALDRDGDGRVELIGKLEARPQASVFGGHRVVAEISFGPGALLDQVRWLPDASTEVPIGAVDFDGNGSMDWISGRALVPGEFAVPDRFQASEPVVSERRMLDMDLDGDLDAFTEIVPSFFGALGGVRANNGAGAFAQSPLLNSAGSSSNVSRPAYALGDLDGNGRPDYLFCELVPGPGPFDPPQELGWRRFELQPGGEFVEQPSPLTTNGVPAFSSPLRGRLIDVDGDGSVDLVPGWTTYFPGDGTGGLGAPVAALDGRVLIDVGDVDGDGDLDQLTGTFSSSFGLDVVLNDLLGPAGSQPLLGLSDPAARFVDLDADGDLDVVAPSFDALEVFENQSGAFLPVPSSPLGLGEGTYSVAFEDLDLDGVTDLAVVASVVGDAFSPPQTSLVQVAYGLQGSLAFSAFENYVAWPQMALGDADGDGDLDLTGTALFRGTAVSAGAGGWTQYGLSFAGAGGLKPLLGATGPLTPGSTTGSLRAVGARGATLGFLGVGSSQAMLLDQPLPGLVKYYDGLLNLVQVPLSGSAAVPGSGEWSYTFPDLAPFAGAVRYCQLFVIDPGAPALVSATNGLRVEFGQ